MAKASKAPKAPKASKGDKLDIDMDKAVKVPRPSRDKLHPHYSDPRAEISFLTNDRWIFRIHLHFLKKKSAFFADMAEVATSNDKPSESMDLDIDRNAMEKYAEYIYGTSHYPTHMRIVTGKGDPEKMFKALATFEKLQDEKLVVRIKADIVTEYRKNTEKAASFMCLALSTSRPEMAADMMLYIPAADGDQTKTVFDMAKISPKTADGIPSSQLILIIDLASQYRSGLPGDKGLWHFVSVSFLDKLGLPQAKGTQKVRTQLAEMTI